jgi:hypothetical protein
MTPAQITRGISMRHYGFGKRIKQIADECGLGTHHIYDAIMAKPLSEAVRARLEGYLLTPVGPSAIHQDNDRGKGMDSVRFAVLRRVLRARYLAAHYGLPLCERARLKRLTTSELRVYFFNLGDRVKRHVMELDLLVTRHWKLADEMEPWEFLERIDVLRASRQARDAQRDLLGQVRTQAGRPASTVVQLRR